MPAEFPYGTLTVNVAGAALVGIMWAVFSSAAKPAVGIELFLMVGIIGSFTTFSTYSLETFSMIQLRDYGKAAANVLANNVLSVAFVFASYYVCMRVFRMIGGKV